MAEEKKFLNEEMEKSNHKLMVKYIALSVVIFVILILCVLAWFSSKQEANASGLTIKATADNGLQVAITDHSVDIDDNGNTVHSNSWTPYAYQQTYHSAFTSSEPLPLISGNGLQFFEPNFIKVAENYYDKLDMDALEDEYKIKNDGKSLPWKDVTNNINRVTHEKEKYIEYKLRFRNNKKCNVFLTNESKVTPDSNDFDNKTQNSKENINTTTNFSRNFISATARIAFLNTVTSGNTSALNLHNLWIPNDDIELNHVGNSTATRYSYDEILSSDVDSTVIKSGGSSGEAAYTGGTRSGYTLWINHSDYVEDTTNGGYTVTLSTQNDEYKDMKKIVDDNNSLDDNNKKKLKGVPLYQVPLPDKDANGNTVYAYYVNLKILPGNYTSNIPMIFTNNTDLQWQLLEGKDSEYVANRQVILYGSSRGSTSYTTDFGTVHFKTSANDGSGNYGSNYNLTPDKSGYSETYSYFETMYIEPSSNNPGGTIQISFTDVKSGGNNNDRESAYSKIVNGPNSGTAPTYDVDVNKDGKYYVTEGDKLVFSASNSSGNSAISSSSPSTGVAVDDPPAGTTEDYWIVDSVNTAGAFTLKQDITNGQYLKVDSSGNLTTDSKSGTQFYAVNKYKINGVEQTLKGIMLFTLEGNYFVNYNGTNFVTASEPDSTYTYHIYKQKGEEYEVSGRWGIRTPNTDPKSVAEKYYCRTVDPTNEKNTAKSPLDNYILSSNLKNIPTEYKPTVDMKDYPNFIVSIGGKKNSEGFFVSEEITVRIWGEGYDREAQTPLQGGWMNVDLHFFAVEQE
ncbi:MAG: hypothetical protein PUE67_06805 [Oscillospiraceae bacterium]|nr:hypothetical protein [Oscillospiraceae bacterium]